MASLTVGSFEKPYSSTSAVDSWTGEGGEGDGGPRDLRSLARSWTETRDARREACSVAVFR